MGAPDVKGFSSRDGFFVAVVAALVLMSCSQTMAVARPCVTARLIAALTHPDKVLRRSELR